MSNLIKILVTGDTNPGTGRVKRLVLNKTLRPLFGDFMEKIQGADISVTNLETPLIEQGTPIQKTGPNLKSPIQSAEVLKHAGINMVTLANNHIMDYGKAGLVSTIKACTSAGIDYVGAGNNSEHSRQPFVTEVRGIRWAFINVAENEFGTTRDDSPGAHALNPVQNFYRIREVRDVVDYVIVIIHGGHENYPLPSPRMKETYRFFVDAGADTVVGHHPHCYSGYEVYRNAPIFYSLGNFLFDKKHASSVGWNEGFMVEFTVGSDGLKFEIIPYRQNGEKTGLRPLNADEMSTFEKNISRLNNIIADDGELENRFNEFCEVSRNLYNSYVEPHSNKYLHALRNRNLFPSLLSQRKKRLLLNLTRCEAHRDVLIKVLKG